mmetsp:Transcript_18369/g.27220  ORF Transcript_18369/g.27220 Transcript_18369/m.27220 type:complete len:211 (+) Transcript_18369:85-717(+)
MIDGSTAQRCIDKLQRIQVRNCRNSNQKHVQCIEGLNLVVGGNASAAEAIILCGWRPPQYFWFVLAGGTADIIQLIIDIVLHLVIGIQDAGICWVTGFAISIIFRHTLHRYLTFGKYKGGYCSSLLRTYATYSITMVLSTIFDEIATRGGGMPHYLAWVVTLLWTGLVNFFLLKWSWSFGGKGKDKKKPQVKAKESLSPLIVENDASTMA